MRLALSSIALFSLAIVLPPSILLIFVGCAEKKPPAYEPLRIDMVRVTTPPVEASANKWTVTQEAYFADGSAYGGYRSIFRIKHADGTEFIGVTGVGISEVGVHGKGQRDER